MLKVGVIGCGYWGPNLIRNFTQLSRSTVVRVADLDKARLKHMEGLYPSLETTTDYQDIVADSEIDLVAVATPVHTHYRIASDALRARHLLDVRMERVEEETDVRRADDLDDRERIVHSVQKPALVSVEGFECHCHRRVRCRAFAKRLNEKLHLAIGAPE